MPNEDEVMAVPIIRQDKHGRNERWALDIQDALVILITPDGRVLVEWTPEQVASAVQFPSFSKSIKYAGFNVAGHGWYQFSIDSASMKQLRAFANRGIAATGPAAVRSVLTKAILACLGGAALLSFGVFALCITVGEARTGQSATNGTPHPIGLVGSLAGIALICRGIYGFRQYSQLKKLDR
jgi:hypothetical protein